MTAKIQPWQENIECDSKGAPRIPGKMESSAGSPERAESWPPANAAPTPGPVQWRDPRNQRPRYCVLLSADFVFSFKFFPLIFSIVQSKST